jgi:hypothetical protein
MHIKKLFKKKEFLYYTGGPLCTGENLRGTFIENVKKSKINPPYYICTCKFDASLVLVYRQFGSI